MVLSVTITNVLLGVVSKVNTFMWDFLLLILLCGTGIYFSFRTGFIQVRKFKLAFKATFGGLSLKGDKAGKDGMSSFQSLATSLAAQVGTGNLAGAATAIASGGPGAIFWMWLSAFFGMSTIFAEATLAQKYKVVNEDGHVTGGPVYYIKAAFNNKFGRVLAGLFALFITLALGFMGNMVQANSIAAACKEAFNVSPLIIGIVVAILAAFVFIGGIGRIASVTEKIVPIMAGLYILGSIYAIVVHYANIIPALASIFKYAFTPSALFGGVVGTTIKQAIRYGVARGLFSNEAGMGSTPNSHALAKVDHPCEQGLVAMIGVFIDTFVILSLTALVILTSGVMEQTPLQGIELTQAAFFATFGQKGTGFIAIIMFFFAFSTIVGWYFFGEQNVRYLFGQTGARIYTVLVICFIVVGSLLKVSLVWDLSDMFNGLMVVPNLLGLLALSGVVVTLLKEFESKLK